MVELVKKTWRHDGGFILSSVAFISGVTLLLYAVSCYLLPPGMMWRSPIRFGFSLLTRPVLWEGAIAIIGLMQMGAAFLHYRPEIQTIAAYPAMIVCFFAAFSGIFFGASVEPLSWFAGAFGVLNLVSLKTNSKRARG